MSTSVLYNNYFQFCSVPFLSVPGFPASNIPFELLRNIHTVTVQIYTSLYTPHQRCCSLSNHWSNVKVQSSCGTCHLRERQFVREPSCHMEGMSSFVWQIGHWLSTLSEYLRGSPVRNENSTRTGVKGSPEERVRSIGWLSRDGAWDTGRSCTSS